MLFDPAGMFRGLNAFVRPFCWIAYLTLPLAGLAALAALFNWYEMTDRIDAVFLSFNFLQSVVLGMVTSNLLGKLAQGTVMARLGIAPRMFGVRLAFGVIPRFFISLQTIRDLDFAAQRRCYAAPLLARLAMFGTGVTAWAMLRQSGSGAADSALAFGVTGLAAFLFTANPAWPADGYRWLSAFLGRPRLREDAFRLLGVRLRGKRPPATLTARYRRMLLLYAAVSIGFTTTLIGGIVISIAHALEAEYRGTGVVIFGVMMGMLTLFVVSLLSRRRIRGQRGKARGSGLSHRETVSCYRHPAPGLPGSPRHASTSIEDMTGPGNEKAPLRQPERGKDPDLESILGPPSAPFQQDQTDTGQDDLDLLLDAALAPPASNPDVDPATRPSALPLTVDGPAIDHPKRRKRGPEGAAASAALDDVLAQTPSPRNRTGRSPMLLVWVLLLGTLFGAGLYPYPFSVGGEFIVQPVERTQIRARTAGEIIALHVREGDWVEKGKILASLSKWDVERDIAVLEAELERQRAELATLTADPRPEEVELAMQGVAAARAGFTAAQEDLVRKQQLFERGAVAQSVLEAARAAHAVAQAELQRSEAGLDLLRSPALQSEVDAATAEIDRIRQDLGFARLRLEHTDIRALANGQIVSTMSGISVGTYLREGDLFAELADNRTVLAEIEVPETEIDEVAIGADVTLKPWSAPNANLSGTVMRRAPAAEERDFGRVTRVVVEVPNPRGTLAGNMTGHAKIEVDERPAWQVFSRVLFRFVEVELWSWLP
ncbi:multidrug resistance efflux pump [Rhodovulum bhavnagarense]|uniref:Multidrug resistance efflux pump n=1 Tax=Rhodovulum bhavnagarense TaxID=992286 RepID=A0A4R2RKH4_9RHOB|nr:multidrug resistance efflux pump [Rhodovulum bhavnagarense]